MSENPIENATMGMQMTGLFNPDCGVFLHPLIGGSGVFTPLIEYEIARLERLIDGPTATGRGSSGMLEALIHLFGYISSYHNARLVVGSNLPRSTTTPQGEGGLGASLR